MLNCWNPVVLTAGWASGAGRLSQGSGWYGSDSVAGSAGLNPAGQRLQAPTRWFYCCSSTWTGKQSVTQHQTSRTVCFCLFWIHLSAIISVSPKVAKCDGPLCHSKWDCTYKSLIWRLAGKHCPRSSVISLLLRSSVSTETNSTVWLPSILRILLWCLENKKITWIKGIRRKFQL